MLYELFWCGAAACGLLASVFCILSARAWVDAPPDVSVGAPFDGYLIGITKDKRKYDIHATLEKQMTWNARAAYTAAAAGVLGVLAFVFQAPPPPKQVDVIKAVIEQLDRHESPAPATVQPDGKQK
jgi:hypothetical protein